MDSQGEWDDVNRRLDSPVAPGELPARILWNFEDMGVGDSFTVFGMHAANRARSAACHYGRRNDRRFTVRNIGPGRYRCTRVG